MIHRVKRFRLRVYPPALLPMFAVYSPSHSLSFHHPNLLTRITVSLAMEAIGDITASSEVSRVAVDGPEFDSRIQGGVLVRLPSHSAYSRH